jgi:hypothetical protein
MLYWASASPIQSAWSFAHVRLSKRASSARTRPTSWRSSQTILGRTGIFAGATGSGSARVNLAAGFIITAAGSITLL